MFKLSKKNVHVELGNILIANYVIKAITRIIAKYRYTYAAAVNNVSQIHIGNIIIVPN